MQHLLRSADAAMYRAKARGGGRAETFTHLLEQEVTRRQQIEVELRRGLRTGQLRVLFQPYRELVTGRLVGFEALVRWDHPKRGTLLPDNFLPLAEETGLIDAVDRWVLGEACRQARRWPAPLLVSVNVSAGRLRRGDLHRDTAAILAETGLSPIAAGARTKRANPVRRGARRLRLARRCSPPPASASRSTTSAPATPPWSSCAGSQSAR